MQFRSVLAVAAVLAAAAAGGASALEARVAVSHLTEANAPAGVPHWWRLAGAAPHAPERTAPIRLALALKHSAAAKAQLEERFWAVSDPKHPDYGKHLSADEVDAMMAPLPGARQEVLNWLARDGGIAAEAVEFSNGGDMAHLTCTVAQAERLLETTYHVYEARSTADLGAQRIIRSLGPYTAPSHVAPYLDFVVGHLGFSTSPLRTPAKTGLKNKVGATLAVTAKQLRERYNITGVGLNGADGNKMAVAEFQGQYYSPSDLVDAFNLAWPGKGYNDKAAKVIGPNTGAAPGVEANLDIQFIMTVAPNIPTYFYSQAAFDFWSDITAWLKILNDDKAPPQVHSISYGDQGEGPAGTYKDRVNTEFQKLGARGLSIIFASGDSGTGCSVCYYFEPSFPATSPYVTSVGATRFLQDSVGPEGAVEAFGSGGGFSWHFEAPKYQTDALKEFFSTATDLPEQHFYNRKGRSTPDVAALGIGFSVYVDGAVQSVGGTSASAPTFSAVIAMLNGDRLAAKKAPLGFLNTWLYTTVAKTPGALYDVTTGNNQHGCCGYTGFSAQKGYDPVTGLGTPNYAVLKTLA